MAALAIHEIGLIAEAIPASDRVILIGERAIEFWVAALGIHNESSRFLASTIQNEAFRFLGPPRAAPILVRALGGCARITLFEDTLNQVTALAAGQWNGRRWAVEFQSGLRGFDRGQLDPVRGSAMPIVTAPGRQASLFALHPVHCLQEQLSEIYGYPLGRRREPDGECHVVRVDLAMEACRRITRRHLDESDLAGAIRIVEALHTISVTPAALRARISDGVQVESAIVDSDAFPKEFRRKRLSHFRHVHRRKVYVYRRRFSHIAQCVAARS